MLEKIIIFGGSGFLGRRITELLKEDYQIILASRDANKNKHLESENVNVVQFNNDINSFIEIIEGTNIIINFSGASIADKRWNDEYKKIMYESRINTTALISNAVNNCINKPHTFVSTSATGIYGSRSDELLYENSSLGNDYLANLCKDWENAAFKSGIRTVCIRVGVVLDKKEGGFKEMIRPFKLFVGGALGNGQQYLPWIHVNDIINIYREAVTNKLISGVVNGTAPVPVTSNEFSKILGKVIKRPAIFKVPKFVLKLILGEFAEFLTGSQRAIPKKLLDIGFSFEYTVINSALENITE